jgi:hypothetical protein
LHTSLQHPTERIWCVAQLWRWLRGALRRLRRFPWANLFSGVIVLGSMVSHSPSLSLAPSAMVQLDSAIDLFRKVAALFRAEKVLVRAAARRPSATHSRARRR